MRRKPYLMLLILLSFALVIAACTQAEEPTPTTPVEEPAVPVEETEEPEEAQEPEETEEETAAGDMACGEPEVTEISLGFGVDPVFAPHIIAMEMGYFEEAGIESVDTATFTAGALAGEALAAGEIEVWTPGNVPPISMRHNGMPIVVVGTNTLAYIESFVARSDAVPQSPEELAEMRIGLLEGSTASAVLNNIADQYGLDVNAMEVVNLPPPEQLASLTNAEIDAFIVWYPWPWLATTSEDVEAEVLHTGTVSHFPWDDGTEYQTSFTRSVWVMSEQFIQDNPNAACAITHALLRGQEYAADPANRDAVVELISTVLDQPLEQNDALWDDYDFDPTFDENYVRDMQQYTEFLFDAGRIEEQLDPLSYTYTDFVQQYDADLVEVEGNWQP